MRSTARNISVAANLALIMLLMASAGWKWSVQHRGDETGEASTRCRSVNRTYEGFINSMLLAQKRVGRSFPAVTLTDIRGAHVSTDFSDLRGAVVLLFKPSACQPCLITQLKALQLMHGSVRGSGDVGVYALGQAPSAEIKRFARAFELEFPLASGTEVGIFETALGRATPVVFLINKQNTIIDCHVASPGRPEFSLLWYNEVRLAIVEKLGAGSPTAESSFGLKGIPFVHVIRNEFDASSVNVGRVLF